MPHAPERKMAQCSDRSTESSSQPLSTADVEKAKKAVKYLSSLDVPERIVIAVIPQAWLSAAVRRQNRAT